jgi:4-hydroxy-tetrahydrodipicolinate synthase
VSKMIDRNSGGVFIIAITPFNDVGAVDKFSTDRLVDYYLDSGVSGITILGMMGEANKLSLDESNLFVSQVIKRVNGKIPVVVGVSSPGINTLQALTRHSMDSGAGGVMVAPASGLNTEQKILSYFDMVCSHLGPDVPICYQDFPQTTNVHISVPTIVKLATDFSQIVMFKHEDWPGLNKLTALRQSSEVKGIPRLSILVGNAALFLPQELQRGADGAMTGFAYPEMLVAVEGLHREGKIDEAENIFDAFLPLIRYEQQIGIGMSLRKEILYRKKVIDSPFVRMPRTVLSGIDQTELSRLMSRLESRLVQTGLDIILENYGI